MSTTETRWGDGVNAEAIQAWDGPLFDRFVQYRDILVAGLGAHGDEALRLNPPQEGQRILDIGCGFGDTTQQIAALVGPSGEAVGVDAAKNFIDASIAEAREAGVANARFFVADVQVRRPRRALRRRLLPHGDDVLHQPRRGPAERPQVARAGRHS